VSLFVTFEGIEGSGKSSHARTLAETLRNAGRGVVETREPGGTPAGAAIRALLLGAEATPLTGLAELFLVCADRAQHVSQVIRPALADGRVVVCDRFSDSTLAYQGYGRGLDLATVRALDAEARAGLEPALTFLLDCPVDVGLGRAKARSGTANRAFQCAVVSAASDEAAAAWRLSAAAQNHRRLRAKRRQCGQKTHRRLLRLLHGRSPP